ncbi:MAG: YdbL family protein [Kiritimatiellaeota bacterium]|nr:YdbL family protein [Kiritimatiellota bacterium]
MKKMMGIVLALVVGFASVSFADAVSDAKDRRKARREEVIQMRKSGAAAEGDDGYLVVKKKEAEAVAKAENADRKIGYEALAKNNGKTVAEIGKQAAEILKKRAAEQ